MKPGILSPRLWLAIAIAAGSSAHAGADPWLQSDENIVPQTLSARLDSRAQNLLFLTPTALLQPQQVVLKQPDGPTVLLNVTKVRIGPPDKTLWEFRFDVGKPYSAGCWILFRDGLDRLREIRIILQGAPKPGDDRLVHTGTWVRLTPVNGRAATRMDLFLAGRLVWGGWELPHAIDEFPRLSETSLWSATADEVNWASLIPHRTPDDERVEALSNQVAKALSRVPVSRWGLWKINPQADPQGRDENGRPWGQWTNLSTAETEPKPGLGPWGVASWIGGAFCRTWNLPIPDTEALLASRSDLPGYSPALNSGLQDDPAFSLDWIRNLGLAVAQGLAPDRKLADDGDDVRDVPFLDALPHSGYAVDDIAALLHLLTVLRPGRIYLASLNEQQLSDGKAGALQFMQPVVLFPWVGEDGNVHVTIFRGPKKISWNTWLGPEGQPSGKRADHVLLVELPLPPDDVELPLLPSQ